MRKIAELQKTVRHKVGINKFADWTEAEMALISNDLHFTDLDDVEPRILDELAPPPMPAQLDWRKHNAVTPIINQGQCGSSWAFAGTGAMEGRYSFKNGTLYQLSAQ